MGAGAGCSLVRLLGARAQRLGGDAGRRSGNGDRAAVCLAGGAAALLFGSASGCLRARFHPDRVGLLLLYEARGGGGCQRLRC